MKRSRVHISQRISRALVKWIRMKTKTADEWSRLSLKSWSGSRRGARGGRNEERLEGQGERGTSGSARGSLPRQTKVLKP